MPSASNNTEAINFPVVQPNFVFFWRGESRIIPLFSLLFGFWYEILDLCFIHSHTPQQKFVRICLKKVHISERHILSCVPQITVRGLRSSASMQCTFFLFFFFFMDFTSLSSIFPLNGANRSSKVGENRRTRGKST